MQRQLAHGLTPGGLNSIRTGFRNAVGNLQDFHVEAVRTQSATARMTEALTKNEMSLRQSVKQRKLYNEVLREQFALQKATTVQWSQNAMGQARADLIVPRGVTPEIDRMSNSLYQNTRALLTARRGTAEFSDAARLMSTRVALASAALQSGSHMMINWGKNVQWAGRQLMVGFTIPFAAFGTLAGAAAYQVDKELTRIAKVYDTTAKTAAGKAEELHRLRAESMQMGTEAAKRYGVALQDTLSVESELAAAGLQGRDLTRGTSEVMRAATLGELDYQETVKATIALQSIYGYSTEQLADKFNFLNALENSTNLSMQDMVDVIPRASGSLQGMNVTLEETGVLMAAMKSRGVEAAQGANALKSAINRVLNPGDNVIEDWRDAGIDIQKIVADSGGNFMKILEDVALVLKRFDDNPTKRMSLIGSLFGTMQMDRIGKVLDGLGDIHDETTQVGRAWKVSQDSAESWGQTATTEMKRISESASGKFKRAIEGVKAELAGIGEPFLKIGAGVLGFIGKILGAFNGMSDGAKTFIAGFMLITAIIGPLIMITGLIANLVGHGLKALVFLGNMATKTRVMTAEQRATQMMSERSALAWSNQATAAQALSGQLQILTTNLQRVAVAQHNMATGQNLSMAQYMQQQAAAQAASQMGLVQNANGRYRNADGTPMNLQQAQRFAQLQQQAAGASQTTANNAARTNRSFGGIATGVAGLAMVGTTMAIASGHADSMLMTITNIALMAATVGPLLSRAFAGGAMANALTQMTTAFGTGRRAGSIAGRGGVGQLASGFSAALRPAGRLLMVVGRFAGVVGIIAGIGYGIAKMIGDMNQLTEQQKDITTSAEGWAEVLGFVYEKAEAIEKVNGKTVNNYDVMAAGILKHKAGLVEYLKSLKDAGKEQELLNAAIYEGVKARTHGASASSAYNAVAASLRSAGYKTTEIEEIMVKVKARIDFETEKDVLDEQAKAFAKDFAKTANNTWGQSKWEGFTRMFSGRDEINNASKEQAIGIANQFWDSFQATTDMQKRRNIYKGLEDAVRKQQKEMWKRLGNDNKKDLRDVGITTAEELQTAYRDFKGLSEIDFSEKYGNESMEIKRVLNTLGGETEKMVGKTAGAEREVAQAIAKKMGIRGDDLDQIYTLSQAMGELDMATMSVKDAEEAWGRAMYSASRHMGNMSKKEKEAYTLKILNQYRAMAGLDKAKTSEQGFGKAVDGSTDKLNKNSDALAENAMSAEDYNNARKEAMSGARDSALGKAEEIWSQQADREVQAIEDRADRRIDALDDAQEKQEASFDRRQEAADARFDKREKNLDKKWDSRMESFDERWDKRIEKEKAAYDKKIENIKKAIEAEEEAEERRQKIFEAEKTRLERMADIANQRIDFNLALNTGNLDEAAKVFNNIQSTQDSWTLDDASAASASGSEKRIDAMNGKVTTLEEARDKRIETLQKVEEAERKALEAKREREQEALRMERERYNKSLEAERERYRKGIEAQKEFIQEQARAQADATRRYLEAQKQKLELELLAIRASTPKNKAEYDKQIKQIEGAYKKYGVRLKDYGEEWTGYIGKYLSSNVKAAANKLDDDIKWKSIGSEITQDMIDGGFNMTTAQFMKWVTTGQLPKDYSAPKKPKTRHTGGPVSGNSKYDNRGGRHWGAGMRRDESMMLLKNNEFVVNGKAHKALGTDFLDQVNKTGQLPAIGGRGMGFAGVFAAAMAGATSKAIESTVNAAGTAAQMMGLDGTAIAGAAGKYGNVFLSGEQLQNAATIIGVGKGMGATQRDLIIAIMTAMQESTLRNLDYGDRDSLGLFQQRPSMGWGTAEQIRTPSYAAKKFFEGLLRVKNRADMPMTLAAQAVQRSAYPYAYAKWEDMARAVVSGTTFQANGFMNTNMKGWRKPVSGYRVSQEWSSRHGGMDFAVPTGTTVRAANAGVVTTSADLRGAGNGGYRSYGRYIVIDHGGKSTLYAHLNQRYAKAGQRVGAGATIGSSGNTGNSTGPHLHFETRGPGGFPGFNPRSLIPGLKVGGFTLNDGLAMLHKNETVLTAPLSEQLKSGIQKIDQGVNNDYNVTIDLRGAYVREEVDIEKAVNSALAKRESKLGRKRSIK
ncbi:tail length tape measure protein [Streptomyces phage Muntaha]|uniref:Tape measure protein n=1 Tax=Streptomyces phage Muntaha TaxID=2713269 RepID=A0A6G8R327_9CAUD|nr:tail length tape measure protein [Streptomyces phage Muntaha]QIN94592.1 tape measure protein [Streptomyces phage Muntaha]